MGAGGRPVDITLRWLVIRNDLNKNLQLFTARYQPAIDIYLPDIPTIGNCGALLICQWTNLYRHRYMTVDGGAGYF